MDAVRSEPPFADSFDNQARSDWVAGDPSRAGDAAIPVHSEMELCGPSDVDVLTVPVVRHFDVLDQVKHLRIGKTVAGRGRALARVRGWCRTHAEREPE